ncbi:MAG: cytochrome c1, partial [Burkholderiaceae bacterium]
MKATYRLFRSFAAVLLAAAISPVFAAGGGYPLDRFPTGKLNDVPALQRGAKLYANYCMGCHSLGSMRFNRMRDLDLTEDQIKENLIFTQAKVGELMTIPMRASDAKDWFGAMPPDLSVTARARSSGDGSGSDWIYTFLRSFYRDANRPTGWNNAVFPSVGMPHV